MGWLDVTGRVCLAGFKAPASIPGNALRSIKDGFVGRGLVTEGHDYKHLESSFCTVSGSMFVQPIESSPSCESRS
jgi:hypothetical protein